MEISEVRLDIDYPYKTMCVGIDPGQVNMGLAFIYNNKATAYQITLSSGVCLVERIVEVMQAVRESFLQGVHKKYRKPSAKYPSGAVNPVYGVVENAAYSAPFGQVPLAEARTAAVMGLMQMSVKRIELLSPGAIRLRAFGDGKKRAEDVFKVDKKHKDAITAIGCALAASKLGDDRDDSERV